MKKLSIVIPCYNEAKNIPLILNRFSKVIELDDLQVVLVDNGSFDESQQVLHDLLPHYPFAKTVRVEKNQGYGFGILMGLRSAKGHYIGWTHADMQTDPYDVLRALEIIKNKEYSTNIFIKGLRKGRPLFDQFFTVGMSFFEMIFLRTVLWDINAQPTIFHRSFFDCWQNPPHDFSLDLYAFYMAKKQNLNIVRFNVNFIPRMHGQSSWNTGLLAKWKFIKRTLMFSAALKKGLKS